MAWDALSLLVEATGFLFNRNGRVLQERMDKYLSIPAVVDSAMAKHILIRDGYILERAIIYAA